MSIKRDVKRDTAPRVEEVNMPLRKGTSKEVVSSNISEFHKGKTYEKTRKKFGKATADKQAVAAALSQKRKSGGKTGRDFAFTRK
jgi:hypothetical protein